MDLLTSCVSPGHSSSLSVPLRRNASSVSTMRKSRKEAPFLASYPVALPLCLSVSQSHDILHVHFLSFFPHFFPAKRRTGGKGRQEEDERREEEKKEGGQEVSEKYICAPVSMVRSRIQAAATSERVFFSYMVNRPLGRCSSHLNTE